MTEPIEGGGWSVDTDQPEPPQTPQERLPLDEGGSEDTPEGVDEPQEPDGGDGGASEDADVEEPEQERRETREARYRREAREAQGRVAELEAQLGILQGAEASRLAAEHLADPGDLFALGATLDELLDERTGAVDPVKVRAAAEALLAKRPGLAKGARLPAPPNFGQGAQGRPAKGPVSWHNVFGGR